MAADNNSGDQLDDFIHSYYYSDCDDGPHPNSSDEEDASCSESGSEPPEDPGAEAEDMAIYDLYDNSARPSPQPPASPVLEDARLELDSVLEHMAEDSRLRPEWRKRHNGRAPLAPLAHKSGEGNLVDSQRPVLSQVRHVGAMRTANETPARITLALVGLGPYTLNDSWTIKARASLTFVPSDPAGPGFSPAIIVDIRSGEYTPAAECEIGRKAVYLEPKRFIGEQRQFYAGSAPPARCWKRHRPSRTSFPPRRIDEWCNVVPESMRTRYNTGNCSVPPPALPRLYMLLRNPAGDGASVGGVRINSFLQN
ncbi:hypothetical protein B0H14DRAFT_3747727 [Mycena olivaceomarginata]|nr:hypothetical protein B0H14DRAFT_3747727 [Mycena olivaceomarginata]